LAGVWVIGEYGDVLIDGGSFEDDDTQMEVCLQQEHLLMIKT
jgi:AP-1 complex subunit gamma-1